MSKTTKRLHLTDPAAGRKRESHTSSAPTPPASRQPVKPEDQPMSDRRIIGSILAGLVLTALWLIYHGIQILIHWITA